MEQVIPVKPSRQICAIVMSIVLNVGLSFAQQTQTIDVISLKSGGKINGKIIEKKEGESVTVLIMPANETMTIRWEDIKDISTMTISSSQSYNTNPSTPVQQASDSGFTSYWLDAGVGGSSAGIASGVSASYLWGHSLCTVRYAYNFELNILGLGPNPPETVWDIGILYGIVSRNKIFYSSISVGLGVVGGVRRGALLEAGWFVSRYKADDFQALGIPIEGQLFLTPLPFLGIGVTAFGDLNPGRSFDGVQLCLRVGKLWQ